MRIWALFMWYLSEQNIDFCDSNSVTLTGIMASFPQKSGKLLPMGARPYFELPPGSGLYLRTSAGTRVTGYAVVTAPNPEETRREDLVTPADVSLTVNAGGGGGGAPMAIDYAQFGAAVAAAMQRQTDTLAAILTQWLSGR